MQGSFVLVTSGEQLDELARVLSYPRLHSRIDPVQAQVFLENIDALAVMASDLPDIQKSRDPADNVILATAVAGDKPGVLELGQIQGTKILTARAALAHIGRDSE